MRSRSWHWAFSQAYVRLDDSHLAAAAAASDASALYEDRSQGGGPAAGAEAIKGEEEHMPYEAAVDEGLGAAEQAEYDSYYAGQPWPGAGASGEAPGASQAQMPPDEFDADMDVDGDRDEL